MATENDALGGKNDSVRIEIDGKIVAICEQYEVSVSVLRQPGAMTIRIGSNQVAQELLASIQNRKSRYKLFIGDVLTQSGIVYGKGATDSNATTIEIKGRDYQSVVYDAFVDEDKTFQEKTYKDFTRRVLNEIGLTEKKGHRLITSNEINRLQLTGRDIKTSTHAVDAPALPQSKETKAQREAKAQALIKEQFGLKVKTFTVDVKDTPDLRKGGFDPAQQLLVAHSLRLYDYNSPSAIVEQRKIEDLKTSAAGGTSEVVTQSLKVKLGTRWHDALERHYKLMGLFLWADAEGNFILARPNANQTPSYRLFRQRGGDRSTTNILKHRFEDDTTERHTRAIVFGRIGKGKNGRNKLRGEFIDEQLKDSDFDAPLVVHDDDIATKEHADYIARKHIAEERRAGFTLVYTVSGHTTTPISSADGRSTNWAVDTIVEVDDRELGIKGNFYIEAIKFRRAPTETELTLMRPEDLVFAEKLYPKR